jgi:uncharacterized protein
VNVAVLNTTLVLRADRTLHWPEADALLVADVHVGKAETFQRHGVSVPSATGHADLLRLSAAIEATRSRELWVLGDLIHGAMAAATTGLVALRARHPDVAFHLVRGNHDRHLPRLPADWGFAEHAPATRLGPFVLRHEPAADARGYVLAGHVHPRTELRAGPDRLRLPCFWFGPDHALLPAFAAFTGGFPVDARAGRTFAIADDEVMPL